MTAKRVSIVPTGVTILPTRVVLVPEGVGIEVGELGFVATGMAVAPAGVGIMAKGVAFVRRCLLLMAERLPIVPNRSPSKARLWLFGPIGLPLDRGRVGIRVRRLAMSSSRVVIRTVRRVTVGRRAGMVPRRLRFVQTGIGTEMNR